MDITYKLWMGLRRETGESIAWSEEGLRQYRKISITASFYAWKKGVKTFVYFRKVKKARGMVSGYWDWVYVDQRSKDIG